MNISFRRSNSKPQTQPVDNEESSNLEILHQVKIKTALLEKLNMEEQIYTNKKLKMEKDLVEILLCEIIVRSIKILKMYSKTSFQILLYREKILLEKIETMNLEKADFNCKNLKVKIDLTVTLTRSHIFILEVSKAERTT